MYVCMYDRLDMALDTGVVASPQMEIPGDLKDAYKKNSMLHRKLLNTPKTVWTIGTIIRFSGSMCWLIFLALPCIVYMMSKKQSGSLSVWSAAFHIFLICLGLGNFVVQFIMS